MTVYKADSVYMVRDESSADIPVYVLVCMNTAISIYKLV